MVQQVVQLTAVDFKETDIHQQGWARVWDGEVSKNVPDSQCIQPRSPRWWSQHGVSLPSTCLAVCKAGRLASMDTHATTQRVRKHWFTETQRFNTYMCVLRASELIHLDSDGKYATVTIRTHPYHSATLPIEHVLHQRICCSSIHFLIGALLPKYLVEVEPVLQGQKKHQGKALNKQNKQEDQHTDLTRLSLSPLWTLYLPVVCILWDPRPLCFHERSHTLHSELSQHPPLLSGALCMSEVFSSHTHWSAGPQVACNTDTHTQSHTPIINGRQSKSYVNFVILKITKVFPGCKYWSYYITLWMSAMFNECI